ncbi:MAG: thioester reductase domain-containing protein, partial [Actinomadura rubrobrunea]|nr:thioester reductase domain-containing protein [Actinomadura rubrobrunea]
VVVDLDAGTRRGFLEELARVWAAGADVDWAKVVGPRPRRTPVLPTYPFQRRAYWPENADPRRSLSRRAVEDADGVGTGLRPRILCAATGETIGEAEVSLSRVPFLDEHRVHGRLVVPGVLFLELVLRCAEEAFGAPARAQDLVVSRSLVLGDDDSATVQAVVDRPASGRARARVFSRDASGRWQQHFETVVQPADADDATEPPPGAVPDAALDVGRDRCAESIDTPDLYGQAWHPMFRIGPSFRLLRGVRRGPGAAVGVLVPPAADAAGVAAGVRPELLLLDACIQLVAVAALSPDGFDGRPVHLGTGYERIWIGDLDGHERLECVAVLRDAPDGPVIGDLRLVGADGETAARIWGASFRPVSRDMLDRLLADHARASGAAGSAAPDAGGVADLLALGEADRERAVLDRLTGMLAAILGCAVDEVEPDAVLVDVADSLMIAEMRTRIEQDLGVPVTMEDLFDGVSLRTLAPVVTGLLPAPGPAADPPSERAREPEPAPDPERAPETATTAEPAAPEPAPARPKSRVRGKTVEEMTALAELDPSIAAVGDPEPPGTAPKATLLTGATGFVGAFLLDELLKRRDGEVYCLVRADDAAHAARRLESNLRRYGLETGARMSRVVPVVGDLAEPLLGLDDARFAELHGEIGDIVHCGGMVKWTYPYSGLAGANVDGTREVLRLATLGAPRPVHFISTVGVFSSKEYTADTVSEDVPLTSSGSLVVGYAQTKWVAERMVRTAAERGLPVTIHRINTGGHSVTGAFNRLDHLSLILKGCVEAGIAPHALALMPVQPAPIDYVAAAVVALADRPEALGGTFHLVNERAMTWRELFDAVEEFGYPLRRLPLDDWREQVTGRNAGTMALLGLAPFLRDTMDHARLPFSESSITKAALEGTGVCCPPLTTELVHTFLRGFVEAGFVPPPRTASARPAPSSSASVSSAS